jgi:hypothetical protein
MWKFKSVLLMSGTQRGENPREKTSKRPTLMLLSGRPESKQRGSARLAISLEIIERKRLTGMGGSR